MKIISLFLFFQAPENSTAADVIERARVRQDYGDGPYKKISFGGGEGVQDNLLWWW